MAGIKGRSGRKKSRDEEALKQLMDAAWPESERIAVIQALSLAAQGGDVQAAKELLDRTFGKATQLIDVEHDFSDLTDEQLIERAKGLASGSVAAGPDTSTG
jgi:hypothetical protein